MEKANRPSSPVVLPYYFAALVSVAVGMLMISMALGLIWWQGLVLVVGISLVVWSITFTLLEVRRIAGISAASRTPDEVQAYRNRVVPLSFCLQPMNPVYITKTGLKVLEWIRDN